MGSDKEIPMKRYGLYVWIEGQKHERFYNPNEDSLLTHVFFMKDVANISHIKLVETYRKKEKITYYNRSFIPISKETFNELERKHQIRYILQVDKK